jgi:multisite-specific tRNA:(cytosine-C5)-methyltransferase
MPRGKGKRGGGGGGRGGKRGGGAGRTDSQRNDRAGGYNVVNQTNETMEAYYKAQKIIGDDEWTEFLEALKVPLPTTFRLTASRS